MSRLKEKLGIDDLPSKNKSTIVIYFLIRLAVIIMLIVSIVMGNWSNVFPCVLALILFVAPTFLEKSLKIDLPDLLEVIILFFVFAAMILGEVNGYYTTYAGWDVMLHTINGFLAAAIGISLIDVLNRHEKVEMDLSPVFVGIFAFSFSMTIGVIWEFFEYAMDTWMGTDMQKDTWIDTIRSVYIDESGKQEVININVESVVINGDIKWDKYLDIGLNDTIHDLFVNFIGAFVFSILGMVYIKKRGKGIAAKFIPVFLGDKTEDKKDCKEKAKESEQKE